MDNLEEKLRNSRQTIQRDLRPPAGGWAAVQAGIAAGVAGAAGTTTSAEATAAGNTGATAATAGTTATGTAAVVGKTSLFAAWVKALLGVVVLGGFAAGGYTLMTEEGSSGTESLSAIAPAAAPAEVPQTVPATAPAPATPNAPTEITALNSGTAEESSAKALAVAGQRSTATPASTVSPPSPPAAPRGPENTAPTEMTTPARRAVPVSDRKEISAPEAALPGIESSALSGDSVLSAGDPAALPFAGGNVAVPTTTSEVGSGDDGAAGNSNPLAGEQAPSAPAMAALLPAVTEDLSSVANTVAFVRAITVEPVAEVTFENVSVPRKAAPVEVKRIEHSFRGLPHAWSAWQVHGGVGAHLTGPRNNFGYGQLYERSAAPFPERVLTLASGEEVGISSTSSPQDTRTQQINDNCHYRLGISRQTHWGGVIRLTANYYRGRYADVTAPGSLATDQFGLGYESRVTANFLDAEFQYTFMRRQRFRPFVGVGSVLLYSSRTQDSDIYYVGETGETIQIPFRTSRSLLNTSLDLTVSAGFQYQLTNRWSLGAQLWGNSGFQIPTNAPFGVEARYLLK